MLQNYIDLLKRTTVYSLVAWVALFSRNHFDHFITGLGNLA